MALWILPKVRCVSVCAGLLFRKYRVGGYQKGEAQDRDKGSHCNTPQNNEEKNIVHFLCVYFRWIKLTVGKTMKYLHNRLSFFPNNQWRNSIMEYNEHLWFCTDLCSEHSLNRPLSQNCCPANGELPLWAQIHNIKPKSGWITTPKKCQERHPTSTSISRFLLSGTAENTPGSLPPARISINTGTFSKMTPKKLTTPSAASTMCFLSISEI